MQILTISSKWKNKINSNLNSVNGWMASVVLMKWKAMDLCDNC